MIDLSAVHKLLNERMGHSYSRRSVFRWMKLKHIQNLGNNRVARYYLKDVLKSLP